MKTVDKFYTIRWVEKSNPENTGTFMQHYTIEEAKRQVELFSINGRFNYLIETNEIVAEKIDEEKN